MRYYFCAFFAVIFAGELFADEPVAIGVSVPLSGPAATYGIDVRNALEFANEQLGAAKYRFIIEDDKCQPKEALAIAQKLTSVDRVKYVLGVPCSGSVLATAPTYEKAKVIAISALGSAPKISKAGDYIFRTRPSDLAGLKLLLQYLSERYSKIGVLTEQTDYCTDIYDNLLRETQGGKLTVINEDVMSGTSDIRPSLLRLRSKGAEAIFVIIQAEQTLLVTLKQRREVGWNVPVYASTVGDSRNLLENAGADAEGLIVFSYANLPESLSPTGQKLYAEYVKKYGPPQSLNIGFLTTSLSFDALHRAISSGENVREHLASSSFGGDFGSYTFDKNGDIQGIDYILKQVKAGKFYPIGRAH